MCLCVSGDTEREVKEREERGKRECVCVILVCVRESVCVCQMSERGREKHMSVSCERMKRGKLGYFNLIR